MSKDLTVTPQMLLGMMIWQSGDAHSPMTYLYKVFDKDPILLLLLYRKKFALYSKLHKPLYKIEHYSQKLTVSEDIT